MVLAGTVLACIMLAFEYYWYKRRVVKDLRGANQITEMTAVASMPNISHASPISPTVSSRSHNLLSETTSNVQKKGIDNKAFERRESNIDKEIRQRKQPNQLKSDEPESTGKE